MKFGDKRKHKIKIGNFVTGRWVLTMKTARMATLRSSKPDGYAEVFRARRNGIFKLIDPQQLAMVFALPHSMPCLIYWDLLHIDLIKTAFLQFSSGETYDLEHRVIHVQLPSDITFSKASGTKDKAGTKLLGGH